MRFELVDYTFMEDCPTYGSIMLEGQFRDTAQDREMHVYANISNFDTANWDEADIYVYAHPFEQLCNAEDYDITANIDDVELYMMRDALLTIMHEKMRAFEGM